MSVTVKELAELVDGNVVGDGAVRIDRASSLEESAAGHVTFVDDEKHARRLAACPASAVIVKPNRPPSHPPNGKTYIEVNEPLQAFLKVFQHLHGRPEPPSHGIDRRAFVHDSAKLGADISVLPFASIGEDSVIGDRCRLHTGVVVGRNCRLGDDVTLYPNVVLYDGCVLGDRVIIHANSVIGGDGFGYRFQDGKHVKIPHHGSVEIGNDVEIGAGTTIDRGTFQATRIGQGTKIDNLVMVAHNCRIGKHNLIVSQVGIAGSSTTGDYVVIAGQAGLADHVHIGDRTVIGAQAGVIGDIAADQRVLGSPARPERDVKVMVLCAEKLPELRRDVKEIKKRLEME